MWYGTIDARTAAWAEAEANKLANEKRKERIAKWIADAAIQRAQEAAKDEQTKV